MQGMQAIKILVVDYRLIVGSGISTILGGYSDFHVVGQAGSGEEALRLCELYSPDIVSIDIDLPNPSSGIELIHRLRLKSPQARILILTNHVNEAIVHDALREGALSYLLKKNSVDEFVQAIRSAYQGIPTLSSEVTRIIVREMSEPVQDGRNLTAREYEVLELIARGLNNIEIAGKLSISLSTVQFHVSNILNKLGVHNRIEATAFAIRHGLAD